MADEDEVEASRAPLIEHLTELRDRLIKALIALAVCVIVCFIFATELFDLLARPLNVALSERGLETRLIFTALHEKFFTDMRLALFGGFFVAFPLIATQVAPGGIVVAELATMKNLERQKKPSRKWLCESNELLSASRDLQVVYYRESWVGDRHLSRLIARRPE